MDQVVHAKVDRVHAVAMPPPGVFGQADCVDTDPQIEITTSMRGSTAAVNQLMAAPPDPPVMTIHSLFTSRQVSK